MSTQFSMAERRADWLPRGVMSGFIATVVMTLLFFVAYGLIHAGTAVQLEPKRGADQFTAWLQALTHNQVIDVAAASFPVAAALHLVVSVLWALLYAYWFERRLPGNDWSRGAVFALIPWILSIAVFFPLIGGGLFGVGIGAGPLPIIGNLILHLGYGLTLGGIYGALGDVPADHLSGVTTRDDFEVLYRYEVGAARGIVIGAILGMVVGAAIAALQQGTTGFGIPPAVFIPLSMLLGASFGGFAGSLSGLSGVPTRPYGETLNEAEGRRAA